MARLKELVYEVHRRSLWQVVGIYLAGSWAVIEVADHVVEKFGLPEWTYGVAVLLLLIGFPIVAATAFVQEGVGARPVGDRSADPGPASGNAGDGTGGGRTVPPGAVPGSATATEAADPDSPRGAAGVRHRLFTWRNALLGGAAAFLLLGTLTGGYLFLRSAGIGTAGTLVAKGVLDDRSRVIVADFESPTGDSSLARTVTEAFRIDLSQSPVVRIAEPVQVREALRRMERMGEELTLDLAREVAVREGIPAVISGEIGAAGTGFLLSARVVSTGDGEVLVSHRESAANAEKIIPAIDRLSKRIRERIGESIGSLGADRPLEQVTTSDLEALRKYTAAGRAIDNESELRRGIALLEEAIAEDTAFAMAYRKIGIALYRLGEERERQVEMFRRAFEHRDRLTDAERYITIATYHTYGTYEPERAIVAYETLLEQDPENSAALNNVAILYAEAGDDEKAVDRAMRAIDADSSNALPYMNVIFSLVSLRDDARSREMLDSFVARFPDNPDRFFYRGHLAALDGDYEMAEREFTAYKQERRTDPSDVADATVDLAALDAVRGRLGEAEARLREAIAARESQGDDALALTHAADLALQAALVPEDAERAARILDEMEGRFSLESLPALDRPYLELSQASTLAGRPDRGRALLAEFESEVAPELRRPPDRWRREAARGLIASVEGRHEAAIEAHRAAVAAFPGCALCGLPELARAFDAAGVPDSAIAVYERYVDTPHLLRLRGDRLFLGPTHERLGQLYDERGDLENAARHYARFVELWAEADEELQPRVRAAQARLEAIVAERG